jgi:hypothetical protein
LRGLATNIICSSGAQRLEGLRCCRPRFCASSHWTISATGSSDPRNTHIHVLRKAHAFQACLIDRSSISPSKSDALTFAAIEYSVRNAGLLSALLSSAMEASCRNSRNFIRASNAFRTRIHNNGRAGKAHRPPVVKSHGRRVNQRSGPPDMTRTTRRRSTSDPAQ